GEAVEGTLLVDRVHHRPAKGEEYDLLALERQDIEPPHPFRSLDPAEHHLRLYYQHLVPPPVRDPELEGLTVAVGSDDGVVTEDDVRHGSREAREENPRREREPEKTDQRLQGHEHVGRQADRSDPSIADRREGLHAEEERLEEAHGPPSRDFQRPGTAELVGGREEEVGEQVRANDEGEVGTPRHRD